MKKPVVVIMAVVLALALVVSGVGVVLADKPQDQDGNYNGNGAPSGPHYNLNLIGMEKGKNPDANMENGNGHRIFVQMSKTDRVTTRILLQEGDFAVIDPDGTDGTARFQLPNPDPDNDGWTEYSVYLRVLGKPGGDIIMDTCATDPLTGEEVCSDLKVVKVRETGHGKQKFENVSKELLYIYAWVCIEVDPFTGDCIAWEYMRVPLFSDVLEDYLWQYDNNGVRIVQLRFYEIPTEVPDPVPTGTPPPP